jgi:hypothetical protein
MIEQAGEDRVLFLKTRPQEHVEMKFPEYVPSTRCHASRLKEQDCAEAFLELYAVTGCWVIGAGDLGLTSTGS